MYSTPTGLAKELFETKDKKKNNNLVKLIQVKQSILKDKIKNMSGGETKIEKTDKILRIVERFIKFNDKIQKQLGEGLKISTPNQMLSRLPITLAQLKAINNSEKLKNEIRNLLFSLYR